MNNNRPVLSKIYAGLVRISHFALILVLAAFIIMFLSTRSRIDAHTLRLQEDLQAVSQDRVKITVHIDETIPVELAVPVAELIDLAQIIPVEIPFSTVVPINTTVRIEETVHVPVQVPWLGTTMVAIPLDLDIPIQEDFPVNTTITIDPEQLGEPVDILYIDQDISVDVPLLLDISLEEIGLAGSLEGLKSFVDTLRFVFLLKSLDWS